MITFKQWLAEESTIPQLDMKARQAFPNTKKRQNDVGSVRVMPDVFYHPNTNTQELTIDTRTMRNSGNVHNQRIMLYHVNFVNQGSPLGDTGARVEPVQLTKDSARVSCDCMDFRFRFADNNHQDDSLAGSPPPAYQRVPGSNRPEANPSHLPGMCKHLMRVVQDLRAKRIVT